MLTVKQLGEKMHVSVRTLHYYDEIGLLKPEERTAQGHRAYGAASQDRLQMVLVFRELQFPLKEIQRLMDAPDFDRNEMLRMQIELLQQKKAHIDDMIALANGVRMLGTQGFEGIDLRTWGDQLAHAAELLKSDPIQAQLERSRKYTESEWTQIGAQIIAHFVAIGDASADEASACIETLRDYLSEAFYPCTNQYLLSFAKLYGGNGALGQEVDAVGGAGTAARVRNAVEAHCAAQAPE